MTGTLRGSTAIGTPTRVDFDVWSTTATLVVTDSKALDEALAVLDDVLASFDATCSRFRPDSEISRLVRTPGVETTLSPTLNASMTHALRVAAATGYLVDPTVAAAVIALGYDGDIADVLARANAEAGIGRPSSTTSGRAPGAWRIAHDPATARIRVPPGIGLDLGATAKALAADTAAAGIAERIGCGVLVGLGGDISVAGPAPEGGWQITVADDHRPGSPIHQQVGITAGGLATSSTAARRWRTSAGWAHHIIDPRTGMNPDPVWRTVAVAAGSCVDANAASTASIVLGLAAPDWLTDQQLPALLVDLRGGVTTLGGWPSEESTP